MTPRERWLATLRHEKADRLPVDYRATDEASSKLVAHMGCGSLDRALELLHVDPVLDVGPRYVGPTVPPDEDVFGIGYHDTAYAGGVYRDAVGHPLARYETVAEIEADYRWPSPNWWDYSAIPSMVVDKEDWVIRGGISEPFATYKFLRGVERGYLDLIENPEMVHHCLGKLYDLCYTNALRIYEAIPGMVIWTWVAEDYGSQEGLIISLRHIEEFFLPHMKRMNDLAHSAGAFTFHHSDGACAQNIPNMVAIGMDVLDPIQWRARGMDRALLKASYGDRIVFHGAMDNQHTLAFGTADEVRREVADNIRLLGPGYILGPCHNLQAISPPENIVAMYEAAWEMGG